MSTAAEEVQQARRLLQAGHAAEAEQACRRALGTDAGSVDAAYLLGLLLLQRGESPAAIEWLGKAAASPGMASVPEAHANLGHALRSVGRIDEASGALERALALRPEYPIALNNLGMVRRAQERYEEAIALYRKALALAPTLMAAQMNLGNVLVDAGRAAEAVEVLRRVVAAVPSNADAVAALAGALEAAGDFAGAMGTYEQALRVNGGHVTSLMNLALLHNRHGRVDESLRLIARAQSLKPVKPGVHEKMGRVLWEAGVYEDGVAHFEQALAEQPPVGLATRQTRVNFATLVPPIYRSLEEVTAWRERLVREVGTLRQEGIRVDLRCRATRAPFYVAYAGLDDREVMRQIAMLHRAPAGEVRSRGATAAAGGRVRVGFVSALFKDHTVGLWTQGIIEKLPRERFEIVVLSIGRHDDAVARFIRSRADVFVELSDQLAQARNAIIDQALDVLVYADIGMEGFGYSLAFSRAAPVQCVMWGHPCTTGLETIDYFISSELAEAEDAQRNYTEQLVRLKHLPLYYHRPPRAVVKDRSHFNLPADAHVYGGLHSTFKLHPAFDPVIGELLSRDPRGLLIVPKTGSLHWDAMVIRRIRAGYGDDVAGRVRFIERMSREDFRSLNLACDATLAPFPFGAGDTSLIAFAEGVPVVTMPTPYLRGRFTHAMYRAMGLTDCVAATPETYVEICLRLANDRTWREAVRQRILASNHVLFENEAGVSALAGWLESVARGGAATPAAGR